MFQLDKIVLTVGLATVAGAGVANAGEVGNRPRVVEQAGGQSPDFLFGRPTTTIGVRAMWRRSRADSEIFDFTRGLLTLEKGDFSAPGIMIDAALPITGRLDALVGFEFSRASARSEYRDFVEDNGLPIEQVTTFDQVNLTGGIELAVLPRGRAIGRYAWIPRGVVPYIGAGGGLLRYQFAQEGNLVDSSDFSIFTAQLESSGWTPSAHVAGGVDVKLSRHFYVSGEARYVWARTDLARDFVGFDDIDLTGLRITGGMQFVF